MSGLESTARSSWVCASMNPGATMSPEASILVVASICRSRVIADRNDTVAGDGNVEVDTGRARTIDDIAGMDEEIAGLRKGRHSEGLHDRVLSAPGPHEAATVDGFDFASARRVRREARRPCRQSGCITIRWDVDMIGVRSRDRLSHAAGFRNLQSGPFTGYAGDRALGAPPPRRAHGSRGYGTRSPNPTAPARTRFLEATSLLSRPACP